MRKIRKLIETSHENEIVCDNPKCDFVVPSRTQSKHPDIRLYINIACPECGENLLTEDDYKQWVALHKSIEFINKWFSWITVFLKKPKERQIIEANIHDGIKMTNKQ